MTLLARHDVWTGLPEDELRRREGAHLGDSPHASRGAVRLRRAPDTPCRRHCRHARSRSSLHPGGAVYGSPPTVATRGLPPSTGSCLCGSDRLSRHRRRDALGHRHGQPTRETSSPAGVRTPARHDRHRAPRPHPSVAARKKFFAGARATSSVPSGDPVRRASGPLRRHRHRLTRLGGLTVRQHRPRARAAASASSSSTTTTAVFATWFKRKGGHVFDISPPHLHSA